MALPCLIPSWGGSSCGLGTCLNVSGNLKGDGPNPSSYLENRPIWAQDDWERPTETDLMLEESLVIFAYRAQERDSKTSIKGGRHPHLVSSMESLPSWSLPKELPTKALGWALAYANMDG